ncbi:polysaccharide ABC transporter ATP-binding protein [Mucilaginibacter sp. McL0603]|uniref:ABC transporter ATP-binding protein n=1 Tax=Mucilaginibacter sp. McL0603 TaxID=3415670 RepID=UPI003CEFCE30
MAKVIKVESLSKAYQLGDFGTGTISRDLERLWASLRGKEDPFLKIGEVNDRTVKSESNVVWSLKDLDFEIDNGDAVGIIGRNGAGKSTLLKILSRVTNPTKGSVKIKGRVASLLEVGTGFHPELTGKENIFLNGAILGMRKTEIKRKFDEIVSFSGVERYIDTPVKRYSSGMYVRLAFAVAAHLESEILIIDEVLAVGDAEFQKKCLGKMGDISKGEGRTVLFVSHNIGAVKSLTKNSLLLSNGQKVLFDSTNTVINHYHGAAKNNQSNFIVKTGDSNAFINTIRIVDHLLNQINYIETGVSIGVEINYEIFNDVSDPVPNILLSTNDGYKIFQSIMPDHKRKKGVNKCVIWFPENFFNNQTYLLTVALSTLKPTIVHSTFEFAFTVEENLNDKIKSDYSGNLDGFLRPKLNWQSYEG